MSLTPAHAVLRDLALAWDAGDGAAYGNLFTTTATYVTFDGQVLHGRQSVAAVHQHLFDGPLRGSRLVMGERSETAGSTTVGPDVHVVLTAGAVHVPDHPGATGRDSVQTLVVVREGDRWRVAAFQNTRIGRTR